MTTLKKSHVWKFRRVGGLDQVCIETGDDLIELDKLDPKLWLVLSCPTKNLEFDQRTLEYIDVDKDGRIRIPELLAAVKWTTAHIKNPGELLKPSDALPLSSINDTTDSGKALMASARQILHYLGKENDTSISLADTGDSNKIFANARFNGDGIVSPDIATDDDLKKVLEDIIALYGSEKDRSGKAGINQAKVDLFFAALQEYHDWKKAEEKYLQGGAEAVPFGDNARAAFEAFLKVKAKIEDYFTRCRIAVFDTKAIGALNPPEKGYSAVALKVLSKTDDDFAMFPIQLIAPNRPLNLTDGINPAWELSLESFLIQVARPLFGSDVKELTESEWHKIVSLFAGYEVWSSSKKGAIVEKLGFERVYKILTGGFKNRIDEIIRQDLLLAKEAAGIDSVDKLVRYYKFIFQFLKNFVNFDDFYDPKYPAIFQIGVIYFDQRSFDLCVRVEDPNAHAAFAITSKIFIAYFNCSRPSGEKMYVAAAITQGESDFIVSGRNGVFYDFKGRDWDASIVKVVENPIGFWQAFWSPYRKIANLVEDQIRKFAESKDNTLQDKAAASVADTAKVAGSGKPSIKKEAFDIAKFAGIFAAIGLAIGAIGGAIGAMLTAFFHLAWWQIPMALTGILIVISGPSLILAWLNLRKRMLSPLLEGNGWAINGRVKINIPLGNAMTNLKVFPPNSKRSLKDPFKDKEAKRKLILFSTLFTVLIGALVWWFIIKPIYFDKPVAKPPATEQTPAPTAAPK